MFNNILLLFFFACSSCCLEFHGNTDNRTDNILCRSCGHHILRPDKIISKESESALYSFTETLFNKKQVLVQFLPKDFFFRFHVITASESTCVGTKEWEESELWFPEYRWKPCFCSECGILVGWIFQNENPGIIQQDEIFFGLILDNLISENSK